MADFRVEHDSMGDVRVPADARWGAQTQRAVENFPISGLRIERGLIWALATIKGAAALENARLKIVDKDIGQAIAEAAAEVAEGKWDRACLPRLGELPLGGTAVGTGINAPKGFARGVIKRIVTDTNLPLIEARDHFEAQGARDGLVEASGVLRTIAVSLVKIANDLRWLGSGPRTGLAEIRIPDLQPGSSIMPGKVYPVIAEAVCQVVAQVMGNDVAVAFGGAAG